MPSRRSLDALGLSIVLIFAGFALAALSGWIMNIYQICQCDMTTIDIKEMMKIAGIIIPPLGAVMGWIG